MMNFNIQLFADAQTNTTGTMSVEMKTFYEKRLIDQAEPRLVHDQFADYYPVPQNGGKTIEFRKYDSLPKASTPLTEGVTPNGQALNVTSITSDLHQYGGWTPLTDVLQMTAIDNNVVQATRVLASQAGRTMDSITRDVLAGGTNVLYAPKQNADGTETEVKSRKALDKSCTLTPKLFFQAAAQLGAMNADPIGDSYVAIIHPYAAYDLKTCKEFMEVHKYADPDTMFRGEIGKLGNIRFIETSEANIMDLPQMFGTLDTVATHDNIEKIYRAMKAAVEDNFKEYGVRFISHSSHWYDWGAMNYSRFIIDNPPKDPEEALRLHNQVWNCGVRAALANGGVLNDHHGVGLKLSRLVKEQYGPAIQVLQALKKELDPNGIMNPYKLGL